MRTPSKERVTVYNFSTDLNTEEETILTRAIEAMWFKAEHTHSAPDVLFLNVFRVIAFSEGVTEDRVDALLKDCGLSDAIIQHAPYFVILPQESSVAVCLILELFRRAHMACLPNIIRPRAWAQFGLPVRAFEMISLNEVLSRKNG
jgi:hypothetical protein